MTTAQMLELAKTSISHVKMWPDGGYRVFAVRRYRTEVEYDSPDKDTLEVYIEGTKIRYYPMDSLPDCLRSQLAMIHTHDWDQYEQLSHYVCLDFPRGLYPEEYEGIGWVVEYYDDRRITHYVLVLEAKDLKKLHE